MLNANNESDKATPRYRSVLHTHQNKSFRISCQYPEVSRYVSTQNIHRGILHVTA